ncbi:MAG: DUF3293 domain-containing protein [Xanthomonadales bacterium]|nr:DUF3293 domain-containing protein [Xanthomonadales bacterium]
MLPPDPSGRVGALLAAYRDTHYEVAMPDGSIATLRVGQGAPPAILDWMQPDPLTAFVSADNPHSCAVPNADNTLRHAALQGRLRALPCRVLPGLGHVPGSAWRENALLVAGLDLGTLDALARAFDQNAIVIAHRGGPARLRMYRPEWRALVPTAVDLDWAE